MARPASILANALILAVPGFAALSHGWFPDAYYLAVQEDSLLEWMTFWAFLAGCAVFFAAGFGLRRRERRVPWFHVGVACFCLFVAMEEISWGQRIIGYRAPVYFLAENFQQELNVHNVFATSLRRLVLEGVLLGYGVVLPLLLAVPWLGAVLERAGVHASPLALAPAFSAAFFAYRSYPWTFTGEIVELMMGFGFLFAGLHACGEDADRPRSRLVGWAVVPILISVATVTALSTAAVGLSQWQRRVDPGLVAAARAEVEALARDFTAGPEGHGGAITRCGLSSRVFTYVKKERRGWEGLLDGAFAALTAEGLPETRAAYFIDPWNTAYWIRHKCSADRARQRVVVYSFGPNRARDSTHWERMGDDIEHVIEETAR